MKNSAIKIGYPANSCMADDLKPAAELLELEGKQGILRSRFIPGAEFLPRRVMDIARCVRNGLFTAGFIGDDTACEEDLEISSPDSVSFPALALAFFDDLEDMYAPALGQKRRFNVRPYLFSPERRIARFCFGDPAFMTLFSRPDIMPFQTPSLLLSSGKIATSYPNLARKALRLSNKFRLPDLALFDGKIEAVVANRDDPDIVAGFDIVRTGKTLEEFGLRQYGAVMESQPGLWRTSAIFRDEVNRISDTIDALKDRLNPFLYD